MTQQNQPDQKNSPNQQQGGHATRRPSDTKTDQR